jgi:hypothetical protein
MSMNYIEREAVMKYGEDKYNMGYKDGYISGIITGTLLSTITILAYRIATMSKN